MEDVLIKALKRKKELQSELAELDQFIETYRRLSGEREAQARLDLRPGTATGASLSVPTLRRRWVPQDFADIAERILTKAGKPLNRYQLVDAIEQEGVVIPSTDKPRFVGTILWRQKDRFVNLKDFGYWLKDRPCGFARYAPGSDVGVISDEDGPDAAHEAR